jgi:hypothetical protein
MTSNPKKKRNVLVLEDEAFIAMMLQDELEGRRDVRPDQRVDQFMRLRKVIEERASRKFFEEQAQSDRPVVLRANDFSK